MIPAEITVCGKSPKMGPERNSYLKAFEHSKWSPDSRYIVFDADTDKTVNMIPTEGGNPIIFLIIEDPHV